MKFTKGMRFDEPFWFSGIYKISQYTWYRGHWGEPYYHAYLIKPGCSNWGDYVGGKYGQYDKRLTFAECVKLCETHAASGYSPLPKQIKQAEIAMKAWLADDKSQCVVQS